MKGLSLTLTVIVVAVALLVTVLVIITIFGGQMASFLGILNPWSEDVLIQSQCNSKCATWCQTNVGTADTGWDKIAGEMTYRGEKQSCSDLQSTVGLSPRCQCSFTGGATLARCNVPSTTCTNQNSDATNPTEVEVDVASSVCTSGKCKVVCNVAGRQDGTCTA